jgi:hypothetical protein
VKVLLMKPDEDRVADIRWLDGYYHGVAEEAKRIREAIENAPVALDFFGPYIPRDELIKILEGKDNE